MERGSLRSDVYWFTFKDVTTNPDELRDVLDFFGCSDVEVDQTATNHKNRKYEGWDTHRADVMKLEWFWEKWNIERDTDRKL